MRPVLKQIVLAVPMSVVVSLCTGLPLYLWRLLGGEELSWRAYRRALADEWAGGRLPARGPIRRR